MMVNILFDEWLYFDINGQAGSYGKDEVVHNYKDKFKAVSIACLDVGVKHLHFDSSVAVRKEDLIAETYEKDTLVLQEWLSASSVQLMSVKRSKIEEIYAYFKPLSIRTVVPYQVAMRAFLKSQGLLGEDTAVIFVDDLKTGSIITIFQGTRFSDARRIAMRDLAYMASEIKRTWQGFNVGRNVDSKYVLVCNNKAWLGEFVAFKLVTQAEILHMDVPYPVLEGLGTAKFINNFILPKDLARQKKQDLLLRRLTDVLILGCTLAVCVAMYGIFWSKELNARNILSCTQQKVRSLKQDLAVAYHRKLIDLLHSKERPHADKVYADLLEHMPDGYQIKEFMLEQTDLGIHKVSALIVPSYGHFYGDFDQQGIWSKAMISDENVNDEVGTRIELTLNDNEDRS